MIKATAFVDAGQVFKMDFLIPCPIEGAEHLHSQIISEACEQAVQQIKDDNFYGKHKTAWFPACVHIKSHSPVWNLDIDDIEM